MPECLSAIEIGAIVLRSYNLAEHLAGKRIPSGCDEPAAVRRLEQWKLAVGDDAAFRAIVGAAGLNGVADGQLLGLLGDAPHEDGSPMPPWASFVQEMVHAVSSVFLAGDGFRARMPASTVQSVPFARLYAPIVALARSRVEARVPWVAGRMRPGAWHGLEHHLLGRLSAICSMALQPAFLAFKAVHESGIPFADSGGGSPSYLGGGPLYRAFVAEQGARGLRRLFLDYPVAARLAAQVTLLWIDFATEFFLRLEADEETISARFFASQPLGGIVSIEAGISDPHHGGRSVLIPSFESGLRIVYKPRPVEIDAAFSDLLRWLNARTHQSALPTLDVLVCEDYGWESFVAHSSCLTRREASQWCRHAGALLYLLHALRGIDVHCENMIATAAGPVIVDVEALCHPTFPEPAFSELDSSVLRTGMLPVPERSFEGQRFITRSALGAPVHQMSATNEIRWRRVNSSRMEIAPGRVRRVCNAHRPRLEGRLLPVRRYLEELVEGFEQTAHLLKSDKQWLSRAAEMDRMKTRVVKRPTLAYAALIRHSLQPRFLTSGLDRSIELQALPVIGGDVAARQAEIAALEMLDVPYFSKVQPPESAPPGAFRPPVEEDLALQVAAIRAAVRGQLTLAEGRVRFAPTARPLKGGLLTRPSS